MRLPDQVLLCEVGPRDGFQYEKCAIPTDLKVEIIRDLTAAGLKRMQVASFVHPRWVPQMADAEEVVARLQPAPDGVVYSGLTLNVRGVKRAVEAGVTHVDVSIATHDRHSLDNANMTVDEALRQAEEMVSLAKRNGLHVQMGLQTVFGFRETKDTPLERVVLLCRRIASWGVDEISLADSTGLANPVQVTEFIRAVRDAVGDVPLVLHLHDTRGLGLANVLAAIQSGVTRFDTSLGGMGGCPFIAGATGNISTEDTAYLLHSMGVRTDVSIESVAASTRRMEAFLGRDLPGKMHRLLGRTPPAA